MEKDASGTYRVGGTRVTLDVVISAFDRGASAEAIVQKFPTLKLSHVYHVLSYVLQHREEIDQYLVEQDGQAKEIDARWESIYPSADMRERLRLLRDRAAQRSRS